MQRSGALLTVLIYYTLNSLGTAASVIPKPPDATMAAKIDWIWENKMKRWTTSDRNTMIDQLFMASAMGTFRVCVRWDADSIVSPTKRDQIESMLSRHMGQWTSCLKGFDDWPWDTVMVRVTGWAVKNRSTLNWNDGDSPARIDVNILEENAPTCNRNCSRAANTSRTYTYPNCPGGANMHWDWYSWNKQGMGMTGYGGPNGFQTDAGMTLRGATGQLHIILHEMGHGFTLCDFYDDDVPGGDPVCVMNAGTASSITEYDRWMLRRIWSEIKRIPGRIPAVTPVAMERQARIINHYAVSAEQGQIRIQAMSDARTTVQVGIYDLAGKMVAARPLLSGSAGMTIAGKGGERIGRGTYLVKITGNSLHEVHRINIAQ